MRTHSSGAAKDWLLLVVSVLAALVAAELAVRVYHGKLWTLSSQLRPPPDRSTSPRALYHPVLGWVPRPGSHEPSASEHWNVDSDGLRSNGNAAMESRAPAIVAVGDSFTFGDEVPDQATWPALLERRLAVPVRNGGVFAYGVDQAYLRAEDLVERFKPQALVFAFIGDDVTRNEFSYYSGSKPYFSYEGGTLTLNNVPVPKDHVPKPRFAGLREALGYSHLGSAIASRTMPRWWTFGTIERAHREGERVTADLLERLERRMSAAGGRFVAVTLATNGRIGNNRRIAAVVTEARRRGVDVLDLASEIEALELGSQTSMFMPRGHYTPELNGLVADRIAERLKVAR